MKKKFVKKVKNTSINNPNGCTSIRADLRDGRKTEVDTISGAVVRAAHKHGVEVLSMSVLYVLYMQWKAETNKSFYL